MSDYEFLRKFILKSAFDPEPILRVLVTREKWKAHTWYDNSSKESYEGPNDCENLFVSAGDELDNLTLIAMTSALDSYTTQVMGAFNDISGFTTARFNRYKRDKHMELHVDHIHSIFPESERQGIPTLSLVGLLNNDFIGGEFCICGEDLQLKAGELVVFPSVFLFPHVVNPIAEGCRYSFVSWAW